MSGLKNYRDAVAAEGNEQRFKQIEDKLDAILKALGGKVEKPAKKAEKQDEPKAE